jgi:hypothetical protein
MNLTIKKPFLIAGLTILFLWSLCIVASIINGSFIPLQTSEFSRLGICLANDSFAPERRIPANAKPQVLICGVLSGDTRRSAYYYIFRNDTAVGRASETVAPGKFFLTPTWWVDELVPGYYRVEARYTRIVVISSEFTVY